MSEEGMNYSLKLHSFWEIAGVKYLHFKHHEVRSMCYNIKTFAPTTIHLAPESYQVFLGRGRKAGGAGRDISCSCNSCLRSRLNEKILSFGWLWASKSELPLVPEVLHFFWLSPLKNISLFCSRFKFASKCWRSLNASTSEICHPETKEREWVHLGFLFQSQWFTYVPLVKIDTLSFYISSPTPHSWNGIAVKVAGGRPPSAS